VLVGVLLLIEILPSLHAGASSNKHVLYHAECTIPTYQSNLRASSIPYTVEPRYCEHNAVCRDYRGVRISEVSGIFPVGVAMHTRAVECYEGAF